jgi:hypothetical protein
MMKNDISIFYLYNSLHFSQGQYVSIILFTGKSFSFYYHYNNHNTNNIHTFHTPWISYQKESE